MPARTKPCIRCEEEWEVSVIVTYGKTYLCPHCAGMKWGGTNWRISEDTRRTREAQRGWGLPWDHETERRMTYEEAKRRGVV